MSTLQASSGADLGLGVPGATVDVFYALACVGYYATALSLGNGQTCALRLDGRVVCWGLNSNGQLGIGNTTNIGVSASQMGNSLLAVDVGTGQFCSNAVLVVSAYISHRIFPLLA